MFTLKRCIAPLIIFHWWLWNDGALFFEESGTLCLKYESCGWKKEVRLAPNLAGQHLVLDIKREIFLFYSTNNYRSLNFWGKILTTKKKLQYTNLYWPPLIGLRNKTVYQVCSVSLIWKNKIKILLVNLNARKDVWKYLKNKISHQNAVLNFIKIYVYRNFSFS